MSPTTRYRTVLYTTVFTTGAAVLVLEIFAVRLLSPYFGTSMFVLSSVLTVVLAALALGYFFGGRVADRYPHHLPLYTIISIAGLSLISCYALAKLVLPYAPAIFPITFGPLFLALALFFIPAFLLGTDSPYVIKLLTQSTDPNSSGSVTGTTFFWSTVGSIVGSLSAGFVLIPFVGIQTSLLIITNLLTLGALCAAWVLSRNTTTPAASPARIQHIALIAIITLVMSGLVLRIAPANPDLPNQRTLYQADGYYGHIRIYEEEFSLSRPPARFLRREVNSESAVFQDSYDYVFEYTRFADLYPELRRASTTSFLMLGGGAYTIPRTLVARNPELQVDVAELEPSLFPLAQVYFGLSDVSRIQNHVMDARVFIQETEKQYDYIFMDTFNSGLYIPAHLTTQEFFTALKRRLARDGLLMINFIGARGLPGTTLTDSFAATLRSVFPNVRAFSTSIATPEILQNIVFIADATDTPLDIDDISFPLIPGAPVPLASLETDLTPQNPAAQVLFTDDRSPAEYLVAKQIAATKNTR